jgi:hypothetical protein
MGATGPAPGPTSRPQLTLGDLIRWQDHGATWRPLDVTDARAVVELCTCYGEPVDTVQGSAPELIEFVRAHGWQQD